MFKVRFTLTIRGLGEWAHLKRDIELPFAPFPGLTVVIDDWQAEAERIWWDHSESRFNAVVRFGVTNQNAQELAREYIAAGWEPVA